MLEKILRQAPKLVGTEERATCSLCLQLAKTHTHLKGPCPDV